MSVMREFPVCGSRPLPRRLARRGLVLLAVPGLLVSACSSGDERASSGASGDTETTGPVAGAQENAVASGAGYRGLGLSDWYLLSKGDLEALCTYAGRNAIGGFPNDKY